MAMSATARRDRHMAGSMVLALVLAGAGCTSTSSPGQALDTSGAVSSSADSPSPTPSESAPNPANIAAEAATSAYLGMWASFATAGETSDWQSPELARHAADEALSVLSRGLYASHHNDLVYKGKPVLNPQVTSVDPPENPSKVVISDCGDSSNWLQYHVATGELADDEPGGRRSITGIVEKQSDGVWRVTGFAVRAVGTC